MGNSEKKISKKEKVFVHRFLNTKIQPIEDLRLPNGRANHPPTDVGRSVRILRLYLPLPGRNCIPADLWSGAVPVLSSQKRSGRISDAQHRNRPSRKGTVPLQFS